MKDTDSVRAARMMGRQQALILHLIDVLGDIKRKAAIADDSDTCAHVCGQIYQSAHAALRSMDSFFPPFQPFATHLQNQIDEATQSNDIVRVAAQFVRDHSVMKDVEGRLHQALTILVRYALYGQFDPSPASDRISELESRLKKISEIANGTVRSGIEHRELAEALAAVGMEAMRP